MNYRGRSIREKDDSFASLLDPTGAEQPFPNFSNETANELRHMLARLQHKESLPERMAVVSALRQEGVSYIAQTLSATMSYDLERRICLVDLNYWWPSPYMDQINKESTLAHVIAGTTLLDDALIQTRWSNLSILPAGDIPQPMRSRVANSMILRDIIEELSYRFDHLILDIPAILSTPDAVTLASLSNATCLVIRQGVTRTEDVSMALDEIEHLNLVGVVLNRFHLETPNWLARLLAL